MRPVSGEVWPASQFMENSVRSGFDKGGKDTQLSYVLGSLYCGAWFLKLSCMYGTFTREMYSWTAISSLRKVKNAIISIWFLSIQLETQCLQDGIAFNKGGKDTRLSYILGSIYCGMLFLKLSCMYETFAPDMYSWTIISSLRKVINAIIWIWFLSIRLETQRLWDSIASICPHKRISYLRSIPNISHANIAAKYIYYFTVDDTL
jgi:hypothetical protein